jgi:MFS family permease
MDDRNESRFSYPGWRVVVASGIGIFFATQTFFTFTIFLKPLSATFGWSREAIAASFGAMTLGSAITAPAMGRLLDRWGLQRIAWVCLTAIGLAVISLAWLTPSLTHFYATFAVIGVAATGTSAVAYARAIASWFDRRRGLALALVLSCSAVGAMLVPPVAQALITRFGWRGAYLALGAVILALGVPPVMAFARERGSASASARANAPGWSVREALGSRAFWTLVLIVFGSTAAMNGLIVHLSALLTDRGLPAQRAATVVAAIGGSTLVGRFATGWLLDRFPAQRLAVVLLAMAATGTFLLARADAFEASLVAAVLAGLGTGGELDVVPYLLSRYFGLRSLSTLFGIVWSGWGVAGVLGPILMGRAFDATGSYEGMLVKLAAGTSATAILALTLPAAEPLVVPRVRIGEMNRST